MSNNFNRYIIFWLSQAVSQFGSYITSFLLVLWAYTQNGITMTISLMTFFNYIPYIIVSLFTGTIVDTCNKKKIMLIADSIGDILGGIIVSVEKIKANSAKMIYILAMLSFMLEI